MDKVMRSLVDLQSTEDNPLSLLETAQLAAPSLIKDGHPSSALLPFGRQIVNWEPPPPAPPPQGGLLRHFTAFKTAAEGLMRSARTDAPTTFS